MNPDHDQVRAEVLAILEILAPGTDVGQLAADAPLRKQIELDSMDWLNVLAAFHERLGVDIPESDYGKLATLNSIVAYLAGRRTAATED
jgi:acyl carrier protein